MRALVLGTGALSLVLLVCSRTSAPLLCLVQVEGASMSPTLQPGREVLFARIPWKPGDIVLADVGEGTPVIKRVSGRWSDWIVLAGDNRHISMTYEVLPSQVRAVMICRTPFTSPLQQEDEQTLREHWRASQRAP